MPLSPIAITAGEPAGVGADIILAMLADDLPARIVVVGDGDALSARARLLKTLSFNYLPEYQPGGDAPVSLLHCPLAVANKAGHPDARNAPRIIAQLKRAADGALHGEFAAVVTAPVDKGLINRGGFAFRGHTEFFADFAKAKYPVMMLSGGGMRVALATTHLPLAEVAKAIANAPLLSILKIINADLRRCFGITSPHIKVAALNPHGGEGGVFGREEIDIIAPAVAAARKAGIDAAGPYPADTLFAPFHRKRADCILAMFHDQGLCAIKCADFFNAVNITLGLPFVRTSPDHGVAYDLAGRAAAGKPLADARSIKAALHTAAQMAAMMKAEEEKENKKK